MASSSCPFYFLFFSSCLLIPISIQSHVQSPEKHASLFIFGDSLFDSGNNNYLKNAAGRANFWPYGETFFKYPTGRFSDGRIIPDFIAEYLKLPLIPPYLQPGNHQFTYGANFASGGAGALVETYQGMVIDLKTQLGFFKKVEKQLRQKLSNTETRTLLSRALYIFSIGGNDYVEPFVTNSSVFQYLSKEEYVGMVIGNVTTVLKEIYKIGGRKFGFLSLLDLGSIPSVRAREQNSPSGLMKEATVLAKLHNKALSNVLKKLQKELQGFKYSVFDFYTSTTDRIKHPSKFCGGESSMLWQWALQRNGSLWWKWDGSNKRVRTV
ncbi:GDSL esterase/lipase 1-like isoform X2 [Hevea brasiliensis]|uniref:GDSL esterase/lipase 1-like isoform X2 n=1 Tax=Hevea brasiliensis TaxID=3981 RepID=UPI0025EFFD70|nr:GDSL esterase/lipase 1-like isoform X2 [Hevea brasiliensis]